jgi:hemerythrin
MSIEWTEQLSTGIAEIDAQHKAVISKFNDLLAACRQQKGNEEIKEFLQFLTDYVIVHFSDEERLMRERGFPGFVGHQREHQEYRERLAKLRVDYVTGVRDDVIAESAWLAGDWFIGHIKRADLVMAEHVRRGSQP